MIHTDTNTAETITALHPAWDPARHILSGIQQALRMSIAGQCLLGMEIVRLKKEMGFTGNTRPTSPDGHFVHRERTWPEWITAELGISYKAADRMILMGESAKSRIKKISHTGDLIGGTKKLSLILDTRPSGLSEEDREALTKVVEKVTDGESQKSLLEELRLVKRHDTSGIGGDTSAHRKDKGEITVQQLAFNFLAPVAEDLRRVFALPELPSYLASLPLDGEEDELTLTMLEMRTREMLGEIETARRHKIAEMKKAR